MVTHPYEKQHVSPDVTSGTGALDTTVFIPLCDFENPETHQLSHPTDWVICVAHLSVAMTKCLGNLRRGEVHFGSWGLETFFSPWLLESTGFGPVGRQTSWWELIMAARKQRDRKGLASQYVLPGHAPPRDLTSSH
jgi:hypothetical protein